MTSPTVTTETAVKKRRRVNLACVNCRDRKVKCDGNLPVCATCIRRKETCVYRKIDGSSVAKSYVKDLERRLGIGDEAEALALTRGALGPASPAPLGISGSPKDTPLTQIDSIQSQLDGLIRLIGLIALIGQSSAYSNSTTTHQKDRGDVRVENRADTRGDTDSTVSMPSGDLGLGLSLLRGNYLDAVDPDKNLPVPTNSLWKILDHKLPADKDEVVRKEQAEYPVDAMGAGSPETETTAQQEFYGSSLAMSFMRALMLSFETRRTEYGLPFGQTITGTKRKESGLGGLGGVNGNINGGAASGSGSGSGAGSAPGASQYRMGRPGCKNALLDWILPLRRVANNYIEIYFRDVLPLYPFLHKPTFCATYEAVWKDDAEVEDDLFYCVMNLIFALGVLHERNDGGHTSNLAKKADVYFERSEAKLASEVLSQGSLILVQALLLKSQYLQATRRAGECWITIGLLVRIAQSLGLHLNLVIQAKESAIEREMCKRLWHGCVMMDIVALMTFGRPLMGTCHLRVDLPSEANDHLITDKGITYNSHELSQGAFFIESLKLYRVLEKILTTFYAVPGQELNASLYLDLFSLEEELQDWARNLPYHLKVENKLEIEPFQRQSTILRARFLHVKVMLHKAILFPDGFNTLDRNSQMSRLCKDVETSSFELCLDASVELIELLKSNSGRIPNILPALWYNVYYLYICTIVLLMGKVRGCVHKETKLFRIESSWADSVGIFKRLSAESESASRCLQYFESVNEKIESMGFDNGKSNPFVFDHDALLPFAYGESNFFLTEFQFPG